MDDIATTAEPDAELDQDVDGRASEPFPWDVAHPPLRGPTIVSSLHMLAPAPVIEFDGETYPSLVIEDSTGLASTARFDLSLTGDLGQRRAVARQLHRVASLIGAWPPDAATPAAEEADAARA